MTPLTVVKPQAPAAPAAHAHHAHHGMPAAAPAGGEVARAVVFDAPGHVEMRTVPLRAMAPDEVAVDTRYSSISSGTERLLFGGRLPGFPHLRFPFVPGYEAAGIVSAVGEDVTRVRVGDAVFVGGSMCYADGVSGVFGGNASRLYKKGCQVVLLGGIPLLQAPLLALAATALHGVLRLGDVQGKRIVVLGMGAVGNLAAQFLAGKGAQVICADLDASRLRNVRGAETLDLSSAPLSSVVTDADAVVDATGRCETIAESARALRSGGSILLLSYYDDLTTPYIDLFVKEVTLLVAREWSHPDLLLARDLIAEGRIDLGALTNHVVPVSDYERAYTTAFEDTSVLKVILQWA